MKDNPTLVFSAPHCIEIQHHNIPSPGPDELLIRTHRSLISIGTELTIFNGDFPKDSAWSRLAQYPFLPGYSNVGRVVDVGMRVDRDWIGRRVCSYGNHAAFTVCNVDAVRLLYHDHVEDEDASFFTIAEIVMNGVRRSGLKWGESAAIYGLGLLGQLAVRFCRIAGACPVVAIDTSTARLEMLGDDALVIPLHPEREPVVDKVKTHTHGRMTDVVFEVTGNAELIPSEFEILRNQGRFIVLGSSRGKTLFDFHDLCNAPSHTIIGAHNYSHPEYATLDNPWTNQRDAELFFDLVAHHQLDVHSLISHRVAYSEAEAIYPQLSRDRSQAMGVVLTWLN